MKFLMLSKYDGKYFIEDIVEFPLFENIDKLKSDIIDYLLKKNENIMSIIKERHYYGVKWLSSNSIEVWILDHPIYFLHRM